MNEWHIQSRAHACQACGKHFIDKQIYHTVLADTRHELQRLDLCEPCWQGEADGARDRRGFISHWQGLFEPPPAAPPEAIRKENAETLLRKLIELNNPDHTAASFILAVMLERKRILKVKEQIQSENGRVFIYEHPKSGDVFTIPDPNLQLNQLEVVQRHVAQLLEHGLTPPSTEPTSPPASTDPAATDPTADPVPPQPAATETAVAQTESVAR